MEFTPKEQVHKHNHVDCYEESQVTADSLCVPLILRNILRHFSNADLLHTLSFVNKFWNYEARSVVRKRGNLIASVKFGDSSCPSSHTIFASCLHQMNVVPYSGISFILTPKESHVCEPPSTEELLGSSLIIILGRLRWKQLSVTLPSGFCTKCKHFPTFHLLKTILKDTCGVLEELSLVSLEPQARAAFIQLFIVEHCSFPRLRVLKLGQLRDTSPWDAKTIKALVSLSPNLQELRLPDSRSVHFHRNVLKGSSAVLLTNCAISTYDRWYCRRSLTDVIRFERVDLGMTQWDFDTRQFNSMIPDMLQRSRTTLRSLCLHSALAVPLMSYGISFDNVRQLKIGQCGDHFLPEIMSLLKTFDFSRIFPNLDRVITGDFGYGHPSENGIKAIIAEQGKGLWKEPLPDRAVKIKHLSISENLNESTAPFFAQILPNVETLSVDPHDPFIPFGLISEHWADLKELNVRNHLREYRRPRYINCWTFDWSVAISLCIRRMPNLDGEFCGIFPQEVALLREKDDEFLRKVNIVPIKPSLSCLKGLRTFKFYCQPHSLEYYESMWEDSSTLSITKVSGLIAFARCPRLSVTLQTVTIEDAEGLLQKL